MRKLKQSLLRQLISVTAAVFVIIFVSLGLLLPKVLLPVYEKNIYQYLKQPLDLVHDNVDDNTIGSDVAYLYIGKEDVIVATDNLSKIIKASPKQILTKIEKEYGKFSYLGTTYYYNTSYNEYVTKIALTNDSYIHQIKKDILNTIFPILLVTLLLIAGLLILWAERIVSKIKHLKEKVDHLDDDTYQSNYQFATDDELKTLSDAIDNMRLTLKEQEEYKNQMYQNISHDFKTPLTVIKSYIEAIEDGMEDKDTGSKIIKEQIDKLENKVHSLLYLNKLNYLKDMDHYESERVDVAEVLRKSATKFKMQRPDLKWNITLGDKKTIFKGTYDMWEAIIDNILNNFVRYAETEIKITLKNNRLTLYNDGANIDPTILDDIFTPYKKGMKGQFGLGLSIVKKTIALFGYEVSVKNEKKGVSFMIK